jgi:hypothetical protein
MRGKYSPTINAAYQADQEWFRNYQAKMSNGVHMYCNYDPEGFDSYGYNNDDVDRAGNEEHEYYSNDGDYDLDEDYNNAYDAASGAWGFDGTKPVQR